MTNENKEGSNSILHKDINPKLLSTLVLLIISGITFGITFSNFISTEYSNTQIASVKSALSISGFSIGDKVVTRVDAEVKKKHDSKKIEGIQVKGSSGIVTDFRNAKIGKKGDDGISWIKVNYDAGVDGWSQASLLTKGDITPPPIDNPPTIKIISPASGIAIPVSGVVFEVEVNDDRGIARVEFLIDKVVVATLTQAPYIIYVGNAPGQIRIATGTHAFGARVFDTGGNMAEEDPEVTINTPSIVNYAGGYKMKFSYAKSPNTEYIVEKTASLTEIVWTRASNCIETIPCIPIAERPIVVDEGNTVTYYAPLVGTAGFFRIQANEIVPPTFLLNVNKAGTGTGTVAGGSVNCGTQCTATLPSNSSITLNAVATVGSSFVGWGGHAQHCANNPSCNITMNDIKNVVANFATPGSTIWQVGTGSNIHDYGVAVANDSQGNVIVGGEVNYRPLIEKRDSSGNVIWSRTTGLGGSGRTSAVTTDTAGNVYATGVFFATQDFSGGAGTGIVTSAGGPDVFMVKYSPAGVLQWVKRYGSDSIGTTPTETGVSISIDKRNGDIVLTGRYNHTIDFGGETISAMSELSVFLAKFTSSGDYKWVKKLASIGPTVVSNVITDSNGNIFLTGKFGQTLNFGQIFPDMSDKILTAVGASDSFIAKYSDSNQLLWVKTYGNKPSAGCCSSNSSGTSIAIDGQNNIVVVGAYKFSLSVGGSVLPAYGYEDIFLAKYNGDTGAHIWSKSFGDYNSDYATGVAVDSNNNIVLSAWGRTPIIFDSIVPSVSVGTGQTKLYLANFDTNGNHRWSREYANNSSEVNGVSIDNANNIYAIGKYGTNNALTFDFGGPTVLTNLAGTSDIILLKLAP